MEEEDAPLIMANHMLTSVQLTTLASHMLLANMIDSPLYLQYELVDPGDCYIVVAIRKGGKALIGIFIGNDSRIHLLEMQADEEKNDIVKRRHMFVLNEPETAEDCWEEISDQMYEWAEGNREQIVIGDKDIEPL